MIFPTNWAQTGGLTVGSEEIDLLCLTYASKGQWPNLTEYEFRQLIDWAKTFCGTLIYEYRKANDTGKGYVPYPAWEFESMMIWFLVEVWRTAANHPTQTLSCYVQPAQQFPGLSEPPPGLGLN